MGANNWSICKICNAEVGFFKRLDAIYELLEVPIIVRFKTFSSNLK